jgi:tetratricopeptide (TPR) repeat protein
MNETLSPAQLAKDAQRSYKKEDYLKAAQEFQAAAEGYQSIGSHLDAAEMFNNSSVAYIQADDAQSALEVVAGTANVFAEAGDLRRQGLALGNHATALEASGQLEEALEMYQQSAELLKQAGETNMRASVMQSLSALQLKTGHQLEALATMQAGLDGIDKPNPKQRALKKLLQMPFKMLNGQ